MIRIVASEALSQELESTEGPVEFVDASRKSLGRLLRPESDDEEDVRIAKERLANNPTFRPGSDVISYLKSLVIV